MTYSSKVQSWDTRMRLSARRVSLNCQVINNIHNHSITVLDISNRHWPPSVKKATAFTQESVARWRKDEVAGEFPSGTWDGIWPQRNYAINTSLRTKGDYWLTEVHLYVKTVTYNHIIIKFIREIYFSNLLRCLLFQFCNCLSLYLDFLFNNFCWWFSVLAPKSRHFPSRYCYLRVPFQQSFLHFCVMLLV